MWRPVFKTGGRSKGRWAVRLYTFPPKESQKAPAKPQKPCGALLIQVPLSNGLSLGTMWIYRVILSVFLGYGTAVAAESCRFISLLWRISVFVSGFFRYRQRKIPSRNNPMSFYKSEDSVPSWAPPLSVRRGAAFYSGTCRYSGCRPP